LFPERLLVRLAPAELTVGEKRYPCDPAYGTEPWHGALEALKGVTWPRARVTVVLSNHFVRYALVPWSAALATPAEEQAYLRHHFAKIPGAASRAWRAPSMGSSSRRSALLSQRAAKLRWSQCNPR
jgi:hypothetical protein